jgi:hypothetical protein
VSLEDGRQKISLKPVSPVHDRPALDRHAYQPNDGSTTAAREEV